MSSHLPELKIEFNTKQRFARYLFEGSTPLSLCPLSPAESTIHSSSHFLPVPALLHSQTSSAFSLTPFHHSPSSYSPTVRLSIDTHTHAMTLFATISVCFRHSKRTKADAQASTHARSASNTLYAACYQWVIATMPYQGGMRSGSPHARWRPGRHRAGRAARGPSGAADAAQGRGSLLRRAPRRDGRRAAAGQEEGFDSY